MPRRDRRPDKAAEVHAWSDRVSDAVALDLMAALNRRPAKVSRAFDVPYVAGYSQDGRTIFIDRHMPRSFRYRGKVVETDRFLVLLREEELELFYVKFPVEYGFCRNNTESLFVAA